MAEKSGVKEAYEQQIKAQLREWNAQIDLLRARAEKAEADARVDYQQRIQELELKQAAAQERLEKLQGASAEAWNDLRAGMDRAVNELQAALKDATDRLRQT
jgi:uncharacterized coiled-coil protein SlyX